MRDAAPQTWRILGASLALALGLAGCDGSDGDEASLTAPVGDDAAPVAAQTPAPGPENAAPIVPRPDLAAPAADRVAAVVEAAEEADRTSRCIRGMEFLQDQMDDFDGPATDRAVVRTGLDTAIAAFQAGDLATCMDAFSDPLAVLGYVIAAGVPEPVPCTRGIDGAILMLDGIGANARSETQAFLDIAIAALERGDYKACFFALGDALSIVIEAQLAGG